MGFFQKGSDIPGITALDDKRPIACAAMNSDRLPAVQCSSVFRLALGGSVQNGLRSAVFIFSAETYPVLPSSGGESAHATACAPAPIPASSGRCNG